MDAILKEAQALMPRLISWRRTLHENAEIGTQLPGTAAFVETELDRIGVEHCRISEYGVVAWIGDGEPAILLRADMDALPGTEKSGLPFACKNGAVHACGHDFHTSMLLGAAVLLNERRALLRGRVVFMFQPGEECLRGASEMVAAGLLDRFSPRCAFAMHVNVADVPSGQVWIKQGTFMAGSDQFTVTLRGKGGHGAHPQNAVNPIYAAVKLVDAFADISRYEVGALVPNVLTVCSIQAGNAGNVIPDHCVLKGSLRTLDQNIRGRILGRMKENAEYIAKAYRCSAEMSVDASCPPTKNNAQLSDWVRSQLSALLGEDRVQTPVMLSMGSEDFSEISSRVPSCYMSIGIPRKEGCLEPLHSERIVFEEDNLYIGSAVFAVLALNQLKTA